MFENNAAGEDSPVCSTCKVPLSVKHILINCDSFSQIRPKHYQTNNLKNLLKNSKPEEILSFLKAINLYIKIMRKLPQLLHQTIHQRFSTYPVDGTHSTGRDAMGSSGRVCLVTGYTSHDLTLSGGGYRLVPEAPLLEECRRGPWHFGKGRARVGSGPAPGPTLKRPCATLVRLVGRRTNTIR